MTQRTIMQPGNVYELDVDDPAGTVRKADSAALDDVSMRICLRAVDFPGGRIPPDASSETCVNCGTEVAVDWRRGPGEGVPCYCWQCAGLSPLNFPAGDIRQ